MTTWTNQNLSSVAGSGGVVGGALGADLTAASTLTITDFVHFVSGSAAISTITGGLTHPQEIFLIPKTGSTWTLTGSGNIKPWSSTPVFDRPVHLVWDGSTSWREIAPPVTDAALSANVALLDRTPQTFTGATSFSNAAGIVERGRTAAMGSWTAFTPVVTPAAGTWTSPTYTTARYMLVGKTLFVTIAMNATLSTNAASIAITIPGGFTSAVRSECVGRNLTPATACIVSAAAGGTTIDLFGDMVGASFSSGATNVRFQMFLEIQ